MHMVWRGGRQFVLQTRCASSKRYEDVCCDRVGCHRARAAITLTCCYGWLHAKVGVPILNTFPNRVLAPSAAAVVRTLFKMRRGVKVLRASNVHLANADYDRGPSSKTCCGWRGLTADQLEEVILTRCFAALAQDSPRWGSCLRIELGWVKRSARLGWATLPASQ